MTCSAETILKMRIPLFNLLLKGFLVVFLLAGACLADGQSPFYGQVNTDNINLRADSSANAEIICTVKKDSRLYVMLERFGWYKVRLPPGAPCYIKKEFVTLGDDPKAGKVNAPKVNLRLAPTESSPILGWANTDETMAIAELTADGQWYKIIPTLNCYGWVNKRFIIQLAQKHSISEKNIGKKFHSGPKQY
ncbi:MAG: SH3 domain-containing protein [Candidatus Omnitrophota bacterium]